MQSAQQLVILSGSEEEDEKRELLDSKRIERGGVQGLQSFLEKFLVFCDDRVENSREAEAVSGEGKVGRD